MQEKEDEKDQEIYDNFKIALELLIRVNSSIDQAILLYSKNKAVTFNTIGSELQAVNQFIGDVKKEVDEDFQKWIEEKKEKYKRKKKKRAKELYS